MNGGDVRAAADAMTAVLRPAADRDWTVRAGDLDWSCWTTAAHIAHDLVAYAGQVSGRPDGGYLPFDLRVRADAAPAEVLTVAAAAAGMLAATIDEASPDDRAWHFGPCDPAGFAAMGVAEIVLHTHDLTRGLDLNWSPPAGLCARVVRRLFPDAPDGDPAPVLLWLTGRAPLGGRPRRTAWTWQAARP
ncbi:maleylpyruvate isomerase N-terminal domain-containing protein [Micromonospora sp. ANENR4]|uniref:maleylpyruvate isomerase N-terminal domain-containing protein n=1 Tax=Micromonospora sp. ANENR4 TaxID=2783662 RepID=UPI00188EFE9F|nr:maleylpyruvate isomerase N-terminal domain-containing protein [Micromonospora sp. ANENR4]